MLSKDPRHTTHHKDLPEHVTITRPQHPLEGQKLAVFGQRRHQDKLHLILTLPKGGRALIPKEWTDIETLSQDPPTQNSTLILVPLGTCFTHVLW
jgi:hypothetical protein